MIDIHTHILPFVDDGSGDMETSIELLKQEISIGVTDVFLTPHYIKSRNYMSSHEENIKVFESFKSEVEKRKLPIRLHLGNEIYYNFDSIDRLRNQTIIPMGQSKMVLIEFSPDEEEDFGEAIHNMTALGFTPIIAHIERYQYIKDFNDYKIIKKMGAKIQVNAASVVGARGPALKKISLKLIKSGLVDFIASDMHAFRTNYMSEAFQFVQKKFGKEMAQHLFNNTSIINQA